MFYVMKIAKCATKYVYANRVLVGGASLDLIAIDRSSISSCDLSIGNTIYFYGYTHRATRSKNSRSVCVAGFVFSSVDEYIKAQSEKSLLNTVEALFDYSFEDFYRSNPLDVSIAVEFYKNKHLHYVGDRLKPWLKDRVLDDDKRHAPAWDSLYGKNLSFEQVILESVANNFPIPVPKNECGSESIVKIIGGRCFVANWSRGRTYKTMTVNENTVKICGSYLSDSLGRECCLVYFSEVVDRDKISTLIRHFDSYSLLKKDNEAEVIL